MLNPNEDRQDYGSILSAPQNYELDFAIGTSYSLDLDSLIGASISLGLNEETDTVLKDNPTYSNKERTGFMNELNKVRKQVVTKKRELASRLNPIEQQIEKYKKRMFNIETELNMNR